MRTAQNSNPCQCTTLAAENLTLRRQLAASRAVISRIRNGETVAQASAGSAEAPTPAPLRAVAKVIPITTRTKKRRGKVDLSDEAVMERMRLLVRPRPLAEVLNGLIQGFPGLKSPSPRCHFCLSSEIVDWRDNLCTPCRKGVNDKSPTWTKVNNQEMSYTEAMQEGATK